MAAAILAASLLAIAIQDPGDIDLTVTEGTSISAIASPDRKSIAMDLQGGLWILPFEGGDAHRITPLTFEARQPAWSPDGRSLTFQGYDDNAWHIYTIAADGSALTALTSGPFDDREPDWSRDGTRIVFASDRFGGIYTAWIADVRSREVRQVSTEPAIAPCWAESDREVIFQGKPASDQPDAPNVWIAAPGGPERLATAQATAENPSGVMTCGNGRGRARGLARAFDAAHEDVFPFLPQWITPRELLYTADGHIKRRVGLTSPPLIVPFRAAVKVRRPEYTRVHRPLQPDGPQRAMGIVDPVVSPDGSRIAFTALGDLWLLPIGGQPRRLTDDPFVEIDPTWSPDGTKIAFASDRGGSMDLWTIDLATGALTQLTREHAMVTSAAWSPSGSRIAYLLDRHITKSIDLIRPGTPARHGTANIMDSGRPTWGPDGRTLLTGELFHYSTRYREGTDEAILRSLDSERPLAFVSLKLHESAGNRQNNGPVWSPDGSRIAFVSAGKLQVVAVGSNAAPMSDAETIAEGSPDSPSWQGDSKHLVYLTPAGLRRISVNGGTPETIPLDLAWRAAASPDRVVVHAGWLFDGKTDGLRPNVDIVVERGRIREVADHQDALHTGHVVDAGGETVMPGLIEMHAHLEPAYGEALGRIWLAYGVTTVRNPATNPYWGLEMREAFDSGRRVGPRVFIAGDPFDGTRIYYAGGVSIADGAQLETELRRATDLTYDFFKTYVRLPDKYQQRVIEYAHANGLPVTSHEIYPAAAFGIDGVEHIRGTSRRGYSPKVSARNISYQDVVDILTRSGMWLTPTIGISGGFGVEVAKDPSMLRDPRLALFPESVAQEYRARFPARVPPETLAREDNLLTGYRRTVAAVKAGGGTIIAGTDSPIIPYGLGLHSELLHFVEAGLSPFQALRTAMTDAAAALGAEDDLGSIEAGKLADFAFVAGDPLKDIRAARDVRRVMRGGRVYSIEELVPPQTNR